MLPSHARVVGCFSKHARAPRVSCTARPIPRELQYLGESFGASQQEAIAPSLGTWLLKMRAAVSISEGSQRQYRVLQRS
jgi:hypothetical protein